MDGTFVLQLSKLLFKLNQLVQGYPARILGERSSSENLLAQELDNTVMWQHGDTSSRHLEYHEPPICHLVREETCLVRQEDIVLELRHEPNS